MSLRYSYTAICEQARIEVFGKFTLIGLTPGSIGLPQIPFAIPMLTFFNVLSIDSPAAYKFEGKITEILSGSIVGRAGGQINPPQAGPIVMPMQFQGLQFKSFGAHMWSLEFEGHEPFATEFQVVHAPQHPQMQVMQRR